MYMGIYRQFIRDSRSDPGSYPHIKGNAITDFQRKTKVFFSLSSERSVMCEYMGVTHMSHSCTVAMVQHYEFTKRTTRVGRKLHITINGNGETLTHMMYHRDEMGREVKIFRVAFVLNGTF